MTGIGGVSDSVHIRRRRFGDYGPLPYVLVLPLVIFIGGLVLYPTIVTFVESFFRVSPLDPPVRFLGIANYRSIFANPDINEAWVNTFIYMLIGVSVSTLMAVLIALGLQRTFRGRAIVLAILVLPWALPAVTEGIIWSWIYDPDFGVLNSVLKSVGIIHDYKVWLSHGRLATIFLVELVQIWQISPLATILIIASLQSIPDELYDAAEVDGAGSIRRLFSIIIPLIRPGITVAVVQSLIVSLNIFAQVYVLNGNALSGSSIMLQTYNVAFQNLDFGEGYALSFSVVMLTMILSVGILRFVYRKVEY
jgi:ABC-type sugar transport system permease subunit